MKQTAARKPGRPANPERCERRREEILDAAVTLFAEHGYADADMQVLADRLGVGKGAVDRIRDVIHGLLYGTMFTNYFTAPRKSFEEQAQDIIDVVFFGILSAEERRRRGN